MKVSRPIPWPKSNLFDAFLSDILPKFNPPLDQIKGARAKPSPKNTKDLKFFK